MLCCDDRQHHYDSPIFFLSKFESKMLSLVKPKAMQFHSVEVCGKYVYGFWYYFHSKTQRTKRPFTLTCLLIRNDIMIGRSVLRQILEKFKVCESVHHHTFQIHQPTRCNNFSSLLLDVYSYVQLNMFQAPLRLSSEAQQLQ